MNENRCRSEYKLNPWESNMHTLINLIQSEETDMTEVAM